MHVAPDQKPAGLNCTCILGLSCIYTGVEFWKKPCADHIQMHALWNAKSGPQTENYFSYFSKKTYVCGPPLRNFVLQIGGVLELF